MPYIRNGRNGRRVMHGFGDFNDESQCSSIPAGDAYRKPGNYCATPDGGYTTFNADGSVYTVPAGSPPIAPPSIWDKIGGALKVVLSPTPVMTAPAVPVDTGMSTTTKIALAGGALLVVALIARR